jgi:uncharacterized protein YchJ
MLMLGVSIGSPPCSPQACCEPYHYGDKVAETPETLMRSRYSAFAKREVASATLLPSSPLCHPTSSTAHARTRRRVGGSGPSNMVR